jgi:hypothetical protein
MKPIKTGGSSEISDLTEADLLWYQATSIVWSKVFLTIATIFGQGRMGAKVKRTFRLSLTALN